MIKYLTVLLILLSAYGAYAKDAFQISNGNGIFNDKSCQYITKDGKSGVEQESTVCYNLYKTDIKDLDEAYNAYIEQYNDDDFVRHLPEKAPADRRDKNKIHIRLVSNGVDYNILFEKKEDGVYVYDHSSFWEQGNKIGEVEPEEVTDKLKVYYMKGIQLGQNYINTDSKVLVKNVYGMYDDIGFYKYEVSTNSIDEAYKIINDYMSKNFKDELPKESLNNIYPPTLDDNKGTKRISDDYVVTNIAIMDVGDYPLELKRKGNIVEGIVKVIWQ